MKAINVAMSGLDKFYLRLERVPAVGWTCIFGWKKNKQIKQHSVFITFMMFHCLTSILTECSHCFLEDFFSHRFTSQQYIISKHILKGPYWRTCSRRSILSILWSAPHLQPPWSSQVFMPTFKISKLNLFLSSPG